MTKVHVYQQCSFEFLFLFFLLSFYFFRVSLPAVFVPPRTRDILILLRKDQQESFSVSLRSPYCKAYGRARKQGVLNLSTIRQADCNLRFRNELYVRHPRRISLSLFLFFSCNSFTLFTPPSIIFISDLFRKSNVIDNALTA